MTEMEILLAAVRRGDERAFEELHDRLALRVYQRLLAVTRGNEALSRDLLQAALLALARRPPSLESEPALLGWLLRVARNAHLDQLRRQRRESLVPLADFDQATEVFIAAPLTALLRETMDALPPEERELLHAAYVDEQPLARIAADHGVTYKALEGRLGRLRAFLRQHLLERLRHES